jgi:Ser-tRNA(Ala) deacylase AlaX
VQSLKLKSLLFRSEKTHQPILVLASGINRVNEMVIEKIIGEEIVKADADYTRDITGFAIGGVPPIGHRQAIHYIFIDEDLLKFVYYTLPDDHDFSPGDKVCMEIDWQRRYKLMRLHFAAELILELVTRKLNIEKIGAHIAETKARMETNNR